MIQIRSLFLKVYIQKYTHYNFIALWNDSAIIAYDSSFKVAVNVSSSVKPVLRFMYFVNEPGLTLLMKKTP